VPVSPPPMANMDYDLNGGMDTPCLVAEKRYDGVVASDYIGDRGQRGAWPTRETEDEDEGVIGGDKNGRGRRIDEDVDMDASNAPVGVERPQAGWGGYVLGALGTVVAGTWAFCKKTAFHGFYAGEGQGYDIGRGTNDMFASESMWEDERDETQQSGTPYTRSFSFERLPTPVPGRYPDDSPPAEEEYQRIDYERRPSKRRQTDGGGWIMIDKKENTPSRASSPRPSLLSTPTATTRPHLRTQSAMVSRRSLASVPRHRRRISAASIVSSPAVTPSARPSSRQSSHIRPTSPNGPTAVKQTSPLSVEAKKYVSRKKKEDREAEERYDRLNDRLKEMIKQGKEALGTKVEIVEDDEIW
jgi:hypothetical protein